MNESGANALFEQAQLEYSDGDLAKAIKIIERLLAEATEYIEAWNLHEWLGLSHIHRDQYAEAISHLKEAYSLVPRSEDGFATGIIVTSLAYAYFRNWELETAPQYFTEAEPYVKFFEPSGYLPELRSYHFNKGRCLLYLDRYEKALEAFREALQVSERTLSGRDLMEDKSVSYLHMGWCCVLLENLTAAGDYLSQVDLETLESSHHGYYHLLLLRLHVLRGDYSEAVKQVEHCLKFEYWEEQKEDLYHFAGRAYLGAGDNVGAREMFELSLRHAKPDSPTRRRSEEYLRELETS